MVVGAGRSDGDWIRVDRLGSLCSRCVVRAVGAFWRVSVRADGTFPRVSLRDVGPSVRAVGALERAPTSRCDPIVLKRSLPDTVRVGLRSAVRIDGAPSAMIRLRGATEPSPGKDLNRSFRLEIRWVGLSLNVTLRA